jgi:hypothetical protein
MRMLIFLLACSCGIPLFAQEELVRIDVLISRSRGNNSSQTEPERTSDASNVAIWLTPLDTQGGTVANSRQPPKSARLTRLRSAAEPQL